MHDPYSGFLFPSSSTGKVPTFPGINQCNFRPKTVPSVSEMHWRRFVSERLWMRGLRPLVQKSRYGWRKNEFRFLAVCFSSSHCSFMLIFKHDSPTI